MSMALQARASATQGATRPALEIAERCLQALVSEPQISAAYVRWRIEVLRAQTAVADALACSSRRPVVSRAAERRTRGLPLLGIDDVAFNSELLVQLARAVVAALPDGVARGCQALHRCAAAPEGIALIEELARKAALDPAEPYFVALSARLGLAPDALVFVGRILAAPFVAAAARWLKEEEELAPQERSGRCHYCGSPPGLAKLTREDGRRILFCSLCGESWESARVECPFCASRDTLNVLSSSADEPRWLESCGRCKGYLKTVDERKLPAGELVIPLVEATRAMYLDLIAEEEGWAKALPYAAPV